MTANIVPGAVFAGYLIERVLGAGGMGTVFLAQHPRLPRRDALKVLSQEHSGDDEFRARFVREAELAARLDHPNVVTVHDRGVEQGRLWIAMQFVDGIDAAQLIAHDAAELPPERALHIIGAAAAGLDAAHRAGLLHRDVKPANILLEPRPGEPDRVYVTDFGIARAAGQSTGLTSVGSVLATLAYAAPEQLMGGPVSLRADVYALGCTLYELLTRAKPFPRRSAVAVMQAHLNDPVPRPTTSNPGLPPAIDTVIARAMAKNPEHRYPSCAALADAAVAAMHGRPDESTFQVAPAVRKRPRRRYLPVAAVAAVAVVAVVSAIALQSNSNDAGPTSTVATQPPSSVVANSTSIAAGTAANSGRTWAGADYIAQAFPELLPPSPFDSGYQGIRCVAEDRDANVVDLNQPGLLEQISCLGNRDPLESILVGCNGNRSPTNVRRLAAVTVVGDQRWERGSGRGRVIWSDDVAPDNDPLGPSRPRGFMQVQFDDPARNFCQLLIWGGHSGQDLYDRWWPGAPF